MEDKGLDNVEGETCKENTSWRIMEKIILYFVAMIIIALLIPWYVSPKSCIFMDWNADKYLESENDVLGFVLIKSGQIYCQMNDMLRDMMKLSWLCLKYSFNSYGYYLRLNDLGFNFTPVKTPRTGQFDGVFTILKQLNK